MDPFPWYALRVRPRFEKMVASALLSKGYEGFLPLYRHRSRWSDRIKEVLLPLFPGYMFCRFDEKKCPEVLLRHPWFVPEVCVVTRKTMRKCLRLQLPLLLAVIPVDLLRLISPPE